MRFDDVYASLLQEITTLDNLLQMPAKADSKAIDDSSGVLTILGIDKKRGPRQQKWGTGQQRLHQNMLPDMHRIDPTLNHKIEMLKKRPGREVCTPVDLKHIEDVFNIRDLASPDIMTRHTEDNPKILGVSQIRLFHDGKNWWMKKQ